MGHFGHNYLPLRAVATFKKDVETTVKKYLIIGYTPAPTPQPPNPNQKPSPSPPPPYKHASILENITYLLSLRQNLDTEHTNWHLDYCNSGIGVFKDPLESLFSISFSRPLRLMNYSRILLKSSWSTFSEYILNIIKWFRRGRFW